MDIPKFHYKKPEEYKNTLVQALGTPSGYTPKSVTWEFQKTYTRVVIRDEYIAHDFPVPHHDFVYSYAKIKLTPAQACALLKVSGSIMPDLLKGEVGARCGGLTKNDVTLSFALDVAEGKAKATKTEYARRITGNIVTRRKFNMHTRM